MKWSALIRPLSETVHHYKFNRSNEKTLTFDDVIGLWNSSSTEGQQFRLFMIRTLVGSPFLAYRLETPVVDLNRKHREFEFVLLNSPGLERSENQLPFARQIENAESEELAIVFPNLGRDAVLIVPTPRIRADRVNQMSADSGAISLESDSGQVNYCHLASFLRTASWEQANDFWQKVGTAMAERLSDQPVWLNTAGGGVAWLHVRLDDRPKYYGYRPYRGA